MKSDTNPMGLRSGTRALLESFWLSVALCCHGKCSKERKTGNTMVRFINGVIAVAFTCVCRRAGVRVCVCVCKAVS